jgi:predicted Zn-dependent protease
LKAANEAATARPTVSALNLVQLPMLRAAVELRRNEPERAIELLKPAAPHELFAPPIMYLRGLAYLAARKGPEAAAEFQKLIDHRGIHWRFLQVLPRDTGPLRAVSYVGLARAATLAGDTSAAKRAYQDFLALWKDADQDLPILLEARKEYAALQ